jgi:hypothetical protein
MYVASIDGGGIALVAENNTEATLLRAVAASIPPSKMATVCLSDNTEDSAGVAVVGKRIIDGVLSITITGKD